MSQLVYATHWLVAALGHVFLIIMPIGLYRLMFSTEVLDFWVKGFLLGTMYIGMIYGVNHIGNHEGFCLLTNLENYYREKEGLNPAPKRFVPRFHKSCKNLWNRIFKRC